MDDKSGNVIDGTARARQWRRSRSKARSEENGGTDIRSDAPKSFASSLLVPADMVHGVLGPAAEQQSALGDGLDGEHDETDAGAPNPTVGPPERRNPFLAPEAAVVGATDPEKRRSWWRQITALIARLASRAFTSRRHRRARPVASANPSARPAERGPRIAGALALGAVIAAAAVLVTQNHDGPVTARSSRSAQTLASLDRLRGIVLSVARPPVEPRQRLPSHPAPRRRAARHRPSHAHRHTTTPVSTTAVVASDAPSPTTATSSAGTPNAPVQAGSSSSAASAPPSASARSSTPTTTKHTPARAFGVGGVLGPGLPPTDDSHHYQKVGHATNPQPSPRQPSRQPRRLHCSVRGAGWYVICRIQPSARKRRQSTA